MMKRAFLGIIFIVSVSGVALAQASGGVAPSEPRFRVVRSVSGSKGSEQTGRFVMEDPRSVFYVPADKHVTVYFEWEGPIGNHHFEGLWKNPDGKVVVMSDFSYSATQKRFGGYWTLDLSDSIATGMWMLEARVDGEVAGAHSFQVVSAVKPAAAPEKPLLTPADIYKRATEASVFIEAIDETHQRLRTGSGFFFANGLLVTAFQVIDGASALRVVLPDGKREEIAEVATYNRLQDWAVLRASSQQPPLAGVKTKSWSVGDRCFSLQVPAEGNRVIVDESITGTQTFPELGERLNVSYPPLPPAIGSPVLNEVGEVIGILGGSIQPGATRDSMGVYTLNALNEGGMATPIQAVTLPQAEASRISLADLRKRGEFLAPVKRQNDLLYGLLGTNFELKKNQLPTSREVKTEFSRAQGTCEVLLVWNPTSKLRGILTMEVYDLHNQTIVRSEPNKVKAAAGTYLTNKWAFPLTKLPASRYRVDVLQDGTPIWRAFFRVID